ncbi:17467_t:CDS:1, partial [Gigaspora margarita]
CPVVKFWYFHHGRIGTVVVIEDVPARRWEGCDSENKFRDCFY